ncbi:hypothetical protein HDV01_002256 [Terramyces sp. JEL0728]|nr:hypothetical protein HDV01_002256 [Terramyces sp. JEL0728]
MKSHDLQLQGIYQLRNQIIKDREASGKTTETVDRENKETNTLEDKSFGQANTIDKQTANLEQAGFKKAESSNIMDSKQLKDKQLKDKRRQTNREIIHILKELIPDLKTKFKTKKTKSAKIDCLLLLLNGINYNIIFNKDLDNLLLYDHFILNELQTKILIEGFIIAKKYLDLFCLKIKKNKRYSEFFLDLILQKLSIKLNGATDPDAIAKMEMDIPSEMYSPNLTDLEMEDCSVDFLPQFTVSKSGVKERETFGNIKVMKILEQLFLLFSNDYKMPPESILSKDYLLIMKIFEIGFSHKLICIEILQDISSYYSSVKNKNTKNINALIGILKNKKKPVDKEYIIPLIHVLSKEKEYWSFLKQLITKNFSLPIQNYLIQNITPFSVNVLGLLMENHQIQCLMVSLLGKDLPTQIQAAKQLALFSLEKSSASTTREIDFYMYHFNIFVNDIKSENEMVGYALFIHYAIKHCKKKEYLCSYLSIYFEKILKNSTEQQEKAVLYSISGLPFDGKIISILRKKSINTRVNLFLYLKRLLKTDYYLNRQIYRIIFGVEFDCNVKYFIPLDELDLSLQIVDICQDILNYGLKYHYICLDYSIKDSDLLASVEIRAKSNTQSFPVSKTQKSVDSKTKSNPEPNVQQTKKAEIGGAENRESAESGDKENRTPSVQVGKKKVHGWKSGSRELQESKLGQIDKSLFEIHLENEILKETVEKQVDLEFNNQIDSILNLNVSPGVQDIPVVQELAANIEEQQREAIDNPITAMSRSQSPKNNLEPNIDAGSKNDYPKAQMGIIEKLTLEELNQNLEKINLPLIRTPISSPGRLSIELGENIDKQPMKSKRKSIRFDSSPQDSPPVVNEISLPNIDFSQVEIQLAEQLQHNADQEGFYSTFQSGLKNTVSEKDILKSTGASSKQCETRINTSSAKDIENKQNAPPECVDPPRSSSISAEIEHNTSTRPTVKNQSYSTPERNSMLHDNVDDGLSGIMELDELENSPVKPLGMNLEAVWRKLGASSPIMDVSMDATFNSSTHRFVEPDNGQNIKPACIINIPALQSVNVEQNIPTATFEQFGPTLSLGSPANSKAIKDAIDQLMHFKKETPNVPVKEQKPEECSIFTKEEHQDTSPSRKDGEKLSTIPQTKHLSKSMNMLPKKNNFKSEISQIEDSIYDISRNLAPGESMIIQTAAPISIPIMKKTLMKAVELSVKHLKFEKSLGQVNYFALYADGLMNGYLSNANLSVDIPQRFVEALHPTLKEVFLLDASLFGEVLTELSLDYHPTRTNPDDMLFEWIQGLVSVHRLLQPLSISFKQMESQLKKPISLGQALVLVRDKISVIKLTSQSKITENDTIRIQSTFDLNGTFGSVNRVYNAAAPFDVPLKNWMKVLLKNTFE